MKEGAVVRRVLVIYCLIYLPILAVTANSYAMVAHDLRALAVLVPLLLTVVLCAGLLGVKTASIRLRICLHGGVLLLLFALSLFPSAVWHIILAVRTIPKDLKFFLWSVLYCVAVEAVVFWVGIVCVYCTSVQLGVRLRVIGALCGMIPIANLIALYHIVRTVFAEVAFEAEREKLDRSRQSERICETKYPLLLVHGVFFRDTKYFNYWGRIPKALERNGATVYYGEHASAASVETCAEELKERIEAIVSETGCGKVNIIAHSKGGLDCRYAIAKLGVAPYVASLTTVNTPHRGCLFAEQLLRDIPESVQVGVASAYNTALLKFGDKDPDFLSAVRDLTAEACMKRNGEMPTPEGIYTASVGSRLNGAAGGRFPLNVSYPFVKHYDGANDGLVSESSFEWGEHYTCITVKGPRGVSHGDMIDLLRENIPEFDVREFYVGLVHGLKERGL